MLKLRACLLALIFVSVCTVGFSQDAETPAEPTEDYAAEDAESDSEEQNSKVGNAIDEIMNSGAIGLLRQGGFFMWPILIMGVVAAGVIIERYRSLKLLTSDTSVIRSQVHELLSQDQVEDALELCDREQGPVPAILSAGLRKYLVLRRLNYDAARTEEQVVKAMDDYSVHIVAALERHLPILATGSSVAPMLGFLGTVQGMIVSFEEIVAKMGETNIVEAAAGGISVALLTTCFGLIIGIPAFVAFNYFSSVINRFVLDVEESATDLIESVTLQMALQEPGESLPMNAPASDSAHAPA
ncbi:MAG: MotA/TolQ/ExbB proton channel family protein [Planctomycetaceae bacterium]|nr:MotA/TolQ/ExbB proton channel family protein [Planctomycetaceae bacterium]